MHLQTFGLIALPLDHFLACFCETFAKQGVQLFYPESVWAISVSNPKRRLKTGGAGELWVLGIAIVLFANRLSHLFLQAKVLKNDCLSFP